MSCRPSSSAFFYPTGWVMPPELSLYHATSSISSEPAHSYPGLLRPPRAAYSHSVSVGSRYPIFPQLHCSSSPLIAYTYSSPPPAGSGRYRTLPRHTSSRSPPADRLLQTGSDFLPAPPLRKAAPRTLRIRSLCTHRSTTSRARPAGASASDTL